MSPGERRRQSRYRQRKRHGIAVLSVPVPEFELACALIQTETLSAAECLNRRAVEHAVAALVNDWVAAYNGDN